MTTNQTVSRIDQTRESARYRDRTRSADYKARTVSRRLARRAKARNLYGAES